MKTIFINNGSTIHSITPLNSSGYTATEISRAKARLTVVSGKQPSKVYDVTFELYRGVKQGKEVTEQKTIDIAIPLGYDRNKVAMSFLLGLFPSVLEITIQSIELSTF